LARGRYKRDSGFLIVLFVVGLILFTFLAAIFLTWEAPVPTRRIEKVLPETSLTGGPIPVDGSGLSEPTPTYVGPIAVPTRQVPIVEEEAPRSPISPVRNSGSQPANNFNTGPIIIDNRVSE